jgi:outer membrane lipoprotein-sorting protein
VVKYSVREVRAVVVNIRLAPPITLKSVFRYNKQMRKILLFLLFTPAFLWAQTISTTDVDLFKKADELASYRDSDFSARYTMTVRKPAQDPSTTIADVWRRDKDEMYTIVIEAPSINKGKGYLKMGDTIWAYSKGQEERTSSRERFQNSGVSNTDFTRSINLGKNYEVVAASDDVIRNLKCRVLELSAKNKNVDYPKMKIWVGSDYLIWRTEEYGSSGQHLRTTMIESYKNIGSHFVPTRIAIQDEKNALKVGDKLQKEVTIISIENPEFGKFDYAFNKLFLQGKSKGN